jgi:drug/metabolite transporter (DMT)-like permease
MFLCAAALWGFAFAAQKAAAELPAFTVGSIRSIMATLFLLPVIAALDKLNGTGRRVISRRGVDFTRHEIIGGIICGTILATASAFQQTGIGDGTDAGKAAFITALYVVIVPIISLTTGKKSPLNAWIGVVLAVVGFYFLCIKEDFTLVPSDALVLICAVIFALHIIAIDCFSPRCDGVRMSCIQFFTAGLVSLPVMLFTEIPSLPELFSVALPILFLGIFSSGVAYTCQIVGQQHLDVSISPIILSLESVFGVVGGAIFLGETKTPWQYLGCGVVLAAVVVAQLPRKKKS